MKECKEEIEINNAKKLSKLMNKVLCDSEDYEKFLLRF